MKRLLQKGERQPELEPPHPMDEAMYDLKELAHFFGGWDNLRKIVDQLEQSEKEAMSERTLSIDLK